MRANPLVSGLLSAHDRQQHHTEFFGIGLGYRIRADDRLTFRFDGPYAHYTDGGGNAAILGVSIDGLFGKQ